MGTNKQIKISPVDPVWGTEDDENLHVVLVHPEIPGNTGNIARLCAGVEAVLHLVEPLGFELKDRYLRRAGLDYWPHMTLCVHDDWSAVEAIFPRERLFLLTTGAERCYTDTDLEPGCVLVLGRETRGLESEITDRYADRLIRIPISSKARSLNIANACAVAVYEARRQQDWGEFSRTADR